LQALFVQFVEFGAAKRHIGYQTFDVKHERHNGFIGHRDHGALSGTHFDQGNITIQTGFPAFTVPKFCFDLICDHL
jgi:hypothetical protein